MELKMIARSSKKEHSERRKGVTLDGVCFNPDLRALETQEDDELNESSQTSDKNHVERRDICRE